MCLRQLLYPTFFGVPLPLNGFIEEMEEQIEDGMDGVREPSARGK
jgi:hypothetical protein